MKTHYSVTLAMLAGFGLGAVAVEGLHAQAKPPVYQVVEIEPSNMEAYVKDYVPKAQAAIKAAGGKFLAAGGKTTQSKESRRKHALLSNSGIALRKSKRIAIQRPSKTSCRSATAWRSSAATPLRGYLNSCSDNRRAGLKAALAGGLLLAH